LAIETYEDHGLRFGYPSDWELEVTDQGSIMTVAVQEPGGLGFAIIQTDESRPDPAEMADAALETMRTEYPELDAAPVTEKINSRVATGHDIEFFALDMTNAASIRSFRTPRCTVLAFGQWSDLGDAKLPDLIRGVIQTIEDTEDE
jgi:hypothetical protein